MPFFTDQLNRTIELGTTPKRIISLVPSQTELLYDLGLEEQVIGITKFCIHPEQWFRTKTRVGGTKTVHIDKVKELQPDLIIANKEENVQQQIEELAQHFPVWISDVTTLEEALQMMEHIGAITDTIETAQQINEKIKRFFFDYKRTGNKRREAGYNCNHKTAYLIWKDPYMTVGTDTFIHNMMAHAGFDNIFSDKTRYPIVTPELLAAMKVELLLLSSEPYPFKQKHIDELQQQLPGTKILLVDGEAFSWYGSRLVHTPAYFEQLLGQLAAIS